MLAQTNLQLYNQLRDAHWRAQDLEDVHRAYEFLARAVAGRRTGSGKPFVCHCVGVAAALAADDAPVDVVIVGLLHAIHTHGDFGSGRVGRPTIRSRRAVRRAVGDRRERLILGYDATSWAWGVDREYTARIDAGTMDDELRQYIRVRAANDVDVRSELGEHYRLQGQKLLSGERLAELCGRAGWTELADRLRTELKAEAADVGPGRVPDAFWPSAPAFVTPRSWRMKLGQRLVNAVRVRWRAR